MSLSTHTGPYLVSVITHEVRGAFANIGLHYQPSEA